MHVRAMLVWGTANPRGVSGTKSSESAFLSTREVELAAVDILGKSVLCEHSGSEIGSVVSAWVYNGELQCVFNIHNSVNGALASEFVRTGRCRELSLGYTMDVRMSKTDHGHRLRFGDKKMKELSLVVKGARHDCNIHAYTSAAHREKK